VLAAGRCGTNESHSVPSENVNMARSSLGVSLVLLTYNGMSFVEECLRMITLQELEWPLEIIHIDSGSTDGTLDVARAFSLPTRHIQKKDFHHSRTRNLAADLARNNLVVYLSQDAIPASRHWLSSLVSPFQDQTVGGVYGRQIPPDTMGPLRKCAMGHLYPDKRDVRDPSAVPHLTLSMLRFSDANAAIRKDLLTRFRFNEQALVCEDHGMCRDILSVGYKVIYEPDAAVIHGHERTLFGEFQWAVDNGISLTRMGILGTKDTTRKELSYGVSAAAQQVRHFARVHQYHYAFMSACTSMVRWFGVQVGKRETRLPAWILHKLSPGLRSVSLQQSS
jgi:rhamnosyltransferase